MLPEKNRLKKRKDFERVLRYGKGIKEDFLFLKIIENKLQNSRFGFVVSQKISKKAVVRNALKRRLREVVRLNLPKIEKGLDGVFLTRPGLEQKDFHGLEIIINKLLKKANILS